MPRFAVIQESSAQLRMRQGRVRTPTTTPRFLNDCRSRVWITSLRRRALSTRLVLVTPSEVGCGQAFRELPVHAPRLQARRSRRLVRAGTEMLLRVQLQPVEGGSHAVLLSNFYDDRFGVTRLELAEEERDLVRNVWTLLGLGVKEKTHHGIRHIYAEGRLFLCDKKRPASS